MNDVHKMITWPLALRDETQRHFVTGELVFKGQMKKFSIDVLTYGDEDIAFPDDATSHQGRLKSLAATHEVTTVAGPCSS